MKKINYKILLILLISSTVGLSQTYNGSVISPFGYEDSSSILVEIDTVSDNVVNNYMSAYVFKGGIFQTTNNGLNWDQKFLNFSPICTNGIKATSIITDGTYYYLGTRDNGIFKSTDGGDIWSNLNSNPRSEINDLLYISSSIYAATDDGLYKSTNSGTDWTQMNNSMVSEINKMVHRSGTNEIYVATTAGFKIYSISGNSWTNVNSSGNYSDITLNYNNGSLYVYTILEYNGLWVYDGSSLTSLVGNSEILSVGSNGTTSVAYGLGGYVNPGEFSLSTDNGNNWNLYNVNDDAFTQDPIVYYNGDVTEIAFITISDSEYIFASDNSEPGVSGLYTREVSDPDDHNKYNFSSGGDSYYLMHTVNFVKRLDANTIFIGTEGYKLYNTEIYESRSSLDDPTPINKYIFMSSYYCHSYSWHLAEDGDLFANIKETYINKTIENGSYVKTNVNDFTNITYDQLNDQGVIYSRPHSGIRYNLDTVISKWNSDGPLLKHEYWDCPYFSDKNDTNFYSNIINITSDISDTSEYNIGKNINLTNTLRINSSTNLRVSQMKNAGIFLKPGFKSIIGAKLHGFTNGHHANENYLFSSKISLNKSEDELEHIIKNMSQEIKEEFHFDFSLYPNPTNNDLSINITKKQGINNNSFVICLYSLSGNKVLTKSIYNENTVIKLGLLSSGLYIIEIQVTELGISRSKLIQIKK